MYRNMVVLLEEEWLRNQTVPVHMENPILEPPVTSHSVKFKIS